MTKRTLKTTDPSEHTSTSERVKTRPRTRNRASSPHGPTHDVSPPEPPVVPKRETPEPEARTAIGPCFLPLALAHLDELAKIWDGDRRIPTIASRRAWALARGLKPSTVHSWWSRRKQVARRARQRVPSGTYELPVGTPPVIKQEEPPAPVGLTEDRASTAMQEDDAGSGTVSSSDPPSSDTLVRASCSPTHLKKPDVCPSDPRVCTVSPLPPSSSPPPSSPALESTSVEAPPYALLYLPVDPMLKTAPAPARDPLATWCTQGPGSAPSPSSSTFLCALCTPGN